MPNRIEESQKQQKKFWDFILGDPEQVHKVMNGEEKLEWYNIYFLRLTELRQRQEPLK